MFAHHEFVALAEGTIALGAAGVSGGLVRKWLRLKATRTSAVLRAPLRLDTTDFRMTCRPRHSISIDE